MRISFNQPAFIPWGGFFARLLHSDKMVLLDDTLLARGFTFVKRNRIKGPDGEVWLTVPFKRKGRGQQKIKDLEIYEKGRWAKKFLLTLRHFYGNSVSFGPIHEKFQIAVETPGDSFLNIILELLNIIKIALDIDTELILQSKIAIAGKGTPLLVSIAKELGAEEVVMPYFSEKHIDYNQFKKENINVRFLRFAPIQYPQFWGDFIKNLSALDLLLCCGKAGRAIIEKGAYLYELETPRRTPIPACPRLKTPRRGWPG